MPSILPKENSGVRDMLGIIGFVIAVIIGAWIINFLLFRSFSVSGPSMETTMYTGDRLIVNRLPVTWDTLRRQAYVPERGQIIVFKNPLFQSSLADEYIVKRVIAFPGERVTVKDGKVTVYNQQNPGGFDPDALHPGAGSPTTGEVDRTVPVDELFVMGDHREGEFSLDSRNGLGTVPYQDLIGPVALRIFPFTKLTIF